MLLVHFLIMVPASDAKNTIPALLRCVIWNRYQLFANLLRCRSLFGSSNRPRKLSGLSIGQRCRRHAATVSLLSIQHAQNAPD